MEGGATARNGRVRNRAVPAPYNTRTGVPEMSLELSFAFDVLFATSPHGP